jgi:hypothetical protein
MIYPSFNLDPSLYCYSASAINGSEQNPKLAYRTRRIKKTVKEIPGSV